MLHYLAVHDLVWINSTITGETQPFEYERLEACMAAQYSYGDSHDVPVQAANFLDTFVRQRPFACGNLRTGFIALAAFLNANGFGIRVTDDRAAELVLGVSSGETAPEAAIRELAEPSGTGLRPGFTLRTLVTYLCSERAGALTRLAEGDC